MPRKDTRRATRRKGGLFGLFNSYKPDPVNPVIVKNPKGYLISRTARSGKYMFSTPIVSKDNGKTWSKTSDYKDIGLVNERYNEVQEELEEKRWKAVPDDQKTLLFESALRKHEMWRRTNNKNPLTPQQIEASRQRFFESGSKGDIHAGGGKRVTLRRRRV